MWGSFQSSRQSSIKVKRFNICLQVRKQNSCYFRKTFQKRIQHGYKIQHCEPLTIHICMANKCPEVLKSAPWALNCEQWGGRKMERELRVSVQEDFCFLLDIFLYCSHFYKQLFMHYLHWLNEAINQRVSEWAKACVSQWVSDTWVAWISEGDWVGEWMREGVCKWMEEKKVGQ